MTEKKSKKHEMMRVMLSTFYLMKMMSKEHFYTTNLTVKHLLIIYHRQRTMLDAGGDS